jgi:phage terminase large subunit-like protein
VIELANTYITLVLEGTIRVGKKARQAVERHLRDLEIAQEKGWVFDETEAVIAMTFVSFLRHTKGEHAKTNFRLQPFQAFMLHQIFGWRMADGTRRFRKAYIRMARKNGKSELAAAIALYMLVADGEPGAEVYAAATIRDQAKKVFDPAAAMMRMLKKDDAEINRITKVFDSKNNCLIKVDDGQIPGIMVPISMDADTSEGSSPHCGIVDEFHLHKTTNVVDMLETGMGGRKQPLLLEITTAGFDTSLPCYHYEATVLKVLSGEVDIDRTFVMIFDLDDDDDWRDSANWEKANPGLRAGFPSLAYLQDEAQKAQVEGFSKEKAFRVKNCNQWLSQAVGWIPEEDWRSAQADWSLEEMAGRKVFLGLDLAAVSDTASICLLFPPENSDESFRVAWKTYCNEEQVDNPKRNEGRVIYRKWAKEGHLTVSDGNTMDFDLIKEDILDLSNRFEIEALGYDRAFGYYIIQDLTNEGFNCQPISQRAISLTVPIYQVETLIKRGMLEVQRNPMVTWQMGNVVMVYEDGDHCRISKKKSPDKIDCIAALLDAMRAYMDSYAGGGQVTIEDLIGRNLIV